MANRKEKEDKSLDVRLLNSILVGHNPNALSIVLIGHLLIEHLLEQIIIAKVKKPALLKGKFSQKLEALYPTWLPCNIYENIKLLNAIRNELAHNLGVSDYMPIIYGAKCEKKIVKIPKGKNTTTYYLKELVEVILYETANYSFDALNIAENIDTKRLFKKAVATYSK